ncbi:MAG: YitT family protein [Chloroflexota bacterium]|nr:MAG: YitT family protein [Chloroflexota bacterium]
MQQLQRAPWSASIVPFILLTLGAFISAVAVIVFEAPFRIAPSGISGVAVILNHLIGTPLGLVVLLGNIPIQILAFRMLGGWRAVAATVYATVAYSLMLDLLTPVFPPSGISNDVLLNAIFGGIIGGIGGGLIYRAGGTLGGTSTLSRILLQRFGIPLSAGALYTDTLVIAAAGLTFGLELALYAMITLYIGAAVSDYVLEGPSVIRTGVIITNRPAEVADALLHRLGRGVTAWEGKGMFTGQARTVLYVTVSRPEVNQLQRLVMQTDPDAFLVIGQGHSAFGEGFRETRAEGPLRG